MNDEEYRDKLNKLLEYMKANFEHPMDAISALLSVCGKIMAISSDPAYTFGQAHLFLHALEDSLAKKE